MRSRPDPDGDLPPLPPFPEPRPTRLPWLVRWLRALALPALALVVVPSRLRLADARAAGVRRDGRDHLQSAPVPPPCIPFRYPDDGCWGRAHEMCRLMLAMGLTPRKVWIDAVGPLLKADTRNHPQCFVQWGWHVAPTICVVRRRFVFPWTEQQVIDPSLFTTPVSKATWKGVQNNPAATLTDTDWTYFRQLGETDPTFVKSDGVLATYRLKLQLRSQSPAEPPPYAFCP